MTHDNDCAGCTNTTGLEVTGSRSLSNFMDANGNLQFLAVLTQGTTQTYRAASDCVDTSIDPHEINKCMGAPQRIGGSAGDIYDATGSYITGQHIYQSFDEYGNLAENIVILGAGTSYQHKINVAVSANFCQYPDPSIISYYMPSSPWVDSFSTPSSPMANPNPVPTGIVNSPQPPEALKSPTCNVPGQCPVDHSDPVNSYDGNYHYDEVDLTVPGVMPLAIERRYYSGKNTTTGEFGVGAYLANYNYTLDVPQDGSHVVTLAPNLDIQFNVGDGSSITFTTPDGTNKFINKGLLGTAGDYITLNLDGSNHYLGAVYHRLDGTVYNFDANSRQVSIVDRNSNQITLTRDMSGKLTRVTDDATGRYINVNYSGSLISSVVDNNSRTVNYYYSGANELQQLRFPDYNYAYYTWDGNHRIIIAKDLRGNAQARNIYDANGSVMRQILADNSTTNLEYTSSTTRTVVDPRGNSIIYTYNAQGMVTGIQDALGHTQTITYSSNFFTNNTSSRYYEITDALSHTMRYDLNANNQVTQITDPDSNITTITYDTSHPDRIKTITDPMSHTTTYDYDTNGNLTKITDNAGKETNFTYNALGQLTSVENALGKITVFAYNTDHQLESFTDPLNQVTAFEYNANGYVSKMTDPKNNETQFAYDSMNRVNQITDANSGVTQYYYDSNGNRTSMVNPRGKYTSYTYDARNRLTSKQTPGSHYYNYYYDGANNLIRFLGPDFAENNYTYDAANRLIQAENPDHTYTYTYDAANQLLSVGDGTDTWSFTYDAMGRIATASAPLGNLSYTYNANSLLTQLTSLTYGTVDYDYDSRDRLTSVTKSTDVYSYGYDDIGRRTSVTRPSGMNTAYTYDDANQVTGISHVKSSVTLDSYTYEYDANGNITKDTQSGGPFGAIVREYAYNNLNQLTKTGALGLLPGSTFGSPGDEVTAKQDILDAIATSNPTTRRTKLEDAVSLGGVVPENARWTYDADGNIASKTTQNLSGGSDLAQTMTYDDGDRLSSISDGTNTTNYSYNTWGNLTSDGTRSLTWNHSNQLTSLNTGSATYNFTYDPLGRRTSLSQGMTAKTYFYAGLNLLSDGASTFLPGVSLDEWLQMSNGGSSYSYLPNQLGSTSHLVSASAGTPVSQYFYQSYGKLENNQTNPTPANPATFTGREDDSTGLLYYRARYYDPNLELFLSQDPLGDAQRYVGGNPLGIVDPLGLWAVAIQVSSGGELGVGPGVAGSVSGGIGYFSGDKGLHTFTSQGGFNNIPFLPNAHPYSETPGCSAIGAYAGLGFNINISPNASTVKEYQQPFQTYNLDSGLGLKGIGGQYATSKTGVNSFSIYLPFMPGLGAGVGFSSYGTK